MATIDSEKTIRELIKSDGHYMDDPRVYQIVEYTNFEGEKCWGVVWENEPARAQHRYELESRYVRDPKVIWSQTNAPNMETKR